MTTMKTWTIKEIEKMTEAEAKAAALEEMQIKEHNIYFVDFGGYFGYSALVFAEGRHIYYANDYELHHNGKNRDELWSFYIKSLNNKLFTEAELADPLKDYNEYDRKSYYLHNYYAQRRASVSMFGIFRTQADEDAHSQKIKNLVFCPTCFGYFADRAFVDHVEQLADALEDLRENTKNDYDYNFAAFLYELGNHEYHINTYQGDYDTLSAFGNIEWHGQGRAAREIYYKELNFTETQRRAFEAARLEFFRQAEENGWY